MNQSENNAQQEDKRLEKLGCIFIVFALLFMILPLIFWAIGKAWEADWASKIGDYEGGLGGALLSFAGLMLLLQTIKEQRRDLQQQIQEMRNMTRIHEEQQFEVTFFQALNGHNELVKHFEMPSLLHPNKGITGKGCFQGLYEKISREVQPSNSVEQILSKYRHFSEANPLILRQFIQSIQQLFAFVHQSKKVNDELKKNLLGFVSAQLTYHEEFFMLLHLTATPEVSHLAELVVAFEIFDCSAEKPFEALNQTVLFKS